MSQVPNGLPPQMQATVFVYMKDDHNFNKEGYPKEWHPDFWNSRIDETKGRVFLCERTVSLDLSKFNPVPTQVAALEAERAQALEQYTKSVADINRQLSELLAIEAPPAPPIQPPYPNEGETDVT